MRRKPTMWEAHRKAGKSSTLKQYASVCMCMCVFKAKAALFHQKKILKITPSAAAAARSYGLK